MFGPTRRDDQGAIFVAMATTFALGAQSSRLPACLTFKNYQKILTDFQNYFTVRLIRN